MTNTAVIHAVLRQLQETGGPSMYLFVQAEAG